MLRLVSAWKCAIASTPPSLLLLLLLLCLSSSEAALWLNLNHDV
jgi:hypothetical protein